ncbi:hypothetical protein SASPL_148486 [Salvia splendens]|uniref:DNA ligase n=1 Tax=Salvia splendens TaxID=180675 RepID=A0A8X8WA13_SALSN|nr:hypothetical protein SASPL_148486 [Salvia splendens]
MSASSRSAFDLLMANASKKKNQPSKAKESSPRKRKSPSKPQSQTPDLLPQKEDTPAPTENQDIVHSCEIGGLKDSDSNQIQTSSSNAKKPKLSITPEESVSELKKKAVEFKAKKAAYWGEGKRVPFMFLAKTLEAVSKESGRIVITGIVCNMLRTVMETAPDDLLAVMYLLVNRIAPAHEGLELGIGESSIIKALAEACGAKEAHIKKQYEELGDLGLVAKAIHTSQPLLRKPEPLTVIKVFDTFRLIAKVIRFRYKITYWFGRTNSIGCIRACCCIFREAFSFCIGRSFARRIGCPQAAKIIKQVYSVIPVYDKIIPALLLGGVWDLQKTCSFSPGIPVGPMLAKPTKGVSEIVEKFQGMEYTCEYKYDGERAQIHYMENGSVEIYSRNAERNTGKFPDVVAAITRLKKPSVKSFVLDCELVAYDRDKQKILPFQILSTRAWKNVVMDEIKVNVCIYAFDILYLDGQLLLQEQLNVRTEHLYKSFQEEPGFFQFATAITSDDLEEIQKFLDDAVNSSSEGLIIKTLKKDATYEPSKRSLNWLKLKKDYMDTIGDSLDLVPIAAFHGRGKRTVTDVLLHCNVVGASRCLWCLSPCYDNDKEEFQSICKIGTGFSEAMLEEHSSSLRSKVIEKPKVLTFANVQSYYRYGDTLSPDVWFEPSEVWEVKAADLTISPVHRAAVGTLDPDKGISLRFPCLLRVREDKNPEHASSSDMVVADMYRSTPRKITKMTMLEMEKNAFH